ncbi:HDOD domain-containing protein [Candidatus Methylocalor cossyra]|uniref:HDOD domain-containing protein n=1 Tax=Candidatus Methylocalor cossyra TaxID=3108543 RepID=UPI0032B1DEF9
MNEIKTLFSLPEVVSKLGGLLNSPTTTNAELGEVLIHDPALTARVLQLANAVRPPSSPPVDTVSGAVALIGRESLRNLILATSVTSRFHGIPPELADMERFWLNSVACGAIARSLAFRCRVFDSEPLFVAGLLHKVGRLVFLSRRPEQYREVLEMGGGSEEALNQAEQVVFGFTHAELGAELLRHWGLSERLQAAVAYHLSPARATRFRKSAALIHVASALACNIEPSVNLDEVLYGDQVGFEKGAWNMLGLPLHVIPLVLDEAWVQAFDIFDIVRPNPLP